MNSDIELAKKCGMVRSGTLTECNPSMCDFVTNEIQLESFADAIRDEQTATIAMLRTELKHLTATCGDYLLFNAKSTDLNAAYHQACKTLSATMECHDAPKARLCSDERMCINCFSDSGDCLGAAPRRKAV